MRQAGATPEQETAPALQAWFDRLAGPWRVERQSSDGSRFSGEAVFTPRANQFLYLEEAGELRLAGGEILPARRAWTWHLRPVNGGADTEIEIRYPEEAGGGLYHRFLPIGQAGIWTGSSEHFCGQDIYRATYRLGAEELFVDHYIRGPAKDYRLYARYRRLTGVDHCKNG